MDRAVREATVFDLILDILNFGKWTLPQLLLT
jgi:hypothetical protein